MKKKAVIIIVIAVVILILDGAGVFYMMHKKNVEDNSFEATQTAICIKKDGTVVEAGIEEFDSTVYDQLELDAFVRAEVADYNASAGAEKIKVQQITVENNIATMYLEYSSPQDYAAFHGVTFFVGTMQEAIDAGYMEDIEFYANAINTYAWDEESGYYGYVDHRGTPHIMKIDGMNGDMGMDGIYPYVAGITDDKKDARIVDHIKNGLITNTFIKRTTMVKYTIKDNLHSSLMSLFNQFGKKLITCFKISNIGNTVFELRCMLII